MIRANIFAGIIFCGGMNCEDLSYYNDISALKKSSVID